MLYEIVAMWNPPGMQISEGYTRKTKVGAKLLKWYLSLKGAKVTVNPMEPYSPTPSIMESRHRDLYDDSLSIDTILDILNTSTETSTHHIFVNVDENPYNYHLTVYDIDRRYVDKMADTLDFIHEELNKWTAVTDDDHHLKQTILKALGYEYDSTKQRSSIAMSFKKEEK